MRNINLSALHASLLKYHDSLFALSPFRSLASFIVCSAQGACLQQSHDVKVVIRIACDCNCRLFRIPFDAILCLLPSLSNDVMAFCATANARHTYTHSSHTFFLVFNRHVVVIAIAIVSLSPLVAPMQLASHVVLCEWKIVAPRSVRRVETLSFNRY